MKRLSRICFEATCWVVALSVVSRLVVGCAAAPDSGQQCVLTSKGEMCRSTDGIDQNN